MTTSNGAWLALVAALTLAPAAPRAQECEGVRGPARLLISVLRVRSHHGLMTASLYGGDKSQFLVKDGALKVWRTAAVAPVTAMCIWLASPGTYAVAIYHDANANKKFDVGPLGPTEAYGFSNNPRKILFSKPSFEAVRFSVHDGDNVVRIRLNNP